MGLGMIFILLDPIFLYFYGGISRTVDLHRIDK
jgi:hypothetical protein